MSKKIFVVLILCGLFLVGCENKPVNDNLNNDNNEIKDDNIINDDNNVNTDNVEVKNYMVSLSGYLDANESYKDRYYGFTNNDEETLTKEFSLNGKLYKISVTLMESSNNLKYTINLDDRVLDVIDYQPDYPDDKNIDLFILDGGYLILGYHKSYIKIYNLNTGKLVESAKIQRDLTVIENRFILNNSTLTFIDISACEPQQMIIDVSSGSVRIKKNAVTMDELISEGYQISGASC